MRKFTIIYNDGTTVHGGGEDDELVPVYFSKKWLEAPNDGVCHINIEQDNGTVIQNQYDYYFMLPYASHGDGHVYGCNSMDAYIRQFSLVKCGGWTSRENFQALMRQARKDNWTPQTNEEL